MTKEIKNLVDKEWQQISQSLPQDCTQTTNPHKCLAITMEAKNITPAIPATTVPTKYQSMPSSLTLGLSNHYLLLPTPSAKNSYWTSACLPKKVRLKLALYS